MDPMKSKRFQVLREKPVNRHMYLKEWTDVGIIAMNGPNDPEPSITIESGRVTEFDGTRREDFGMIEQYIADYYIDTEIAREMMNMDCLEIARMITDTCIPRAEIINITRGLTPAKLMNVVSHLDIIELMMGIHKMRARKKPSVQCHVTNAQDNPVLMAADAAEAALRGFSEEETTVGVARIAPMNAFATILGSQTGRGGVLNQCAVEEATELILGMRGLTSYAETVSVYGTDRVFVDGDDTPWSKAFLASAYTSRGIKLRFTSGSGSEVQMGYAEGRSMLYNEIRCLMVTKGAGVQGTQNGGISCIGIAASVPSGVRSVIAENLIAMMMDLEVASGCDQIFSPSDLRRAARTYPLMFAGTDFIMSGFGSVPNYDNMFAGANFHAEDFDDYLVVQRDLMVDGGLRPVTEEAVIKVRNKAAKALQAVFEEFDFPPVTDEEVEAATYAHGSKDIVKRDFGEDLKAAQAIIDRKITGLDLVKALAARGFMDIAENLLQMQKQKVAGDYLHTSAIIEEGFKVNSAVNQLNDYQGPGTGYRISAEDWEKIKSLPQETDPETWG